MTAVLSNLFPPGFTGNVTYIDGSGNVYVNHSSMKGDTYVRRPDGTSINLLGVFNPTMTLGSGPSPDFIDPRGGGDPGDNPDSGPYRRVFIRPGGIEHVWASAHLAPDSGCHQMLAQDDRDDLYLSPWSRTTNPITGTKSFSDCADCGFTFHHGLVRGWDTFCYTQRAQVSCSWKLAGGTPVALDMDKPLNFFRMTVDIIKLTILGVATDYYVATLPDGLDYSATGFCATKMTTIAQPKDATGHSLERYSGAFHLDAQWDDSRVTSQGGARVDKVRYYPAGYALQWYPRDYTPIWYKLPTIPVVTWSPLPDGDPDTEFVSIDARP